VTFKQLKFSQNVHETKKDGEPSTLMKKCTTLIKKKLYNFYEKHYTVNFFQKTCYGFEKTPKKLHMKNNN